MSTPAPIERRHRVIPLSTDARLAPLTLFFGGSFDPPHRGHAMLPAMVLARLGEHGEHGEHGAEHPARIIYVPAARSPHKHNHPTADHHRLAMLRLGLRDVAQAEIWEQELRDGALNPGDPSYWADTWAIVRSMDLPGITRFLIGTDQMLSMHRWHRYTEFWDDAVVMLRDQGSEPEVLFERLASLGVWSESQLEHWRSRLVPVQTIDASSTAIRAALADPQRRENPIGGLDDRVHEYILENGLYTLA